MKDQQGKRVVIIGAGFSGLAAAAVLGRHGYQVTVLEKNDQAGGRARVIRDKGFVFDMGPSWYLMPQVFEDFFSKFGHQTADFYKLVRLDPNYRVFFSSGLSIDIPADRNSIGSVFESLEPGGRDKLEKYLGIAQNEYGIAMKDFMYREYRSVLDFFRWKVITQGTKLHVLESIDNFAKRYFSKKELRQILEYTMVFLGGSPSNTPALYAIMSHVDFNLGVWYPQGGLGELVKAFIALNEENGVRIINNQPVHRIEVNRDRIANRIHSGDTVYDCDLVIVNADYHHAEIDLLEPRFRTYADYYWRSRTMGPSAFLLYLGFDQKVGGILHHNLYLESAWEDHFDSIFKNFAWPSTFSYYMSCPSKSDPSVAPPGCENIFILVPVAPGLDDNDDTREHFFNLIMSKIEKLVGRRLRDSLIYKKIYAHRDFIGDYNAYKGTALGMSHTLGQTAVFRPAHRSKKIKNLFYTGNYTHPGVGVPMALISAQIVCQEIQKQYD